MNEKPDWPKWLAAFMLMDTLPEAKKYIEERGLVAFTVVPQQIITDGKVIRVPKEIWQQKRRRFE